MTDSISDDLHKLNEEFAKLLGMSSGIHSIEKTTPKQLTQLFGLTISEARIWLKSEPSFEKSILGSSDDSYHDSSNRRKVNRTLSL
jgi:hypothetical protein